MNKDSKTDKTHDKIDDRQHYIYIPCRIRKLEFLSKSLEFIFNRPKSREEGQANRRRATAKGGQNDDDVDLSLQE